MELPSGRSGLRRIGLVLLVAGTALLAYWTSFSGVFLFDDEEAILTNPNVRSLWPLWRAMQAPTETTVEARPIGSLTLAINYALGGKPPQWLFGTGPFDPRGYHVFNLVVHVAAAVLLFGFARRSLKSARMPVSLREHAGGLALAVALIWLAHPLQTKSVTYVVQRVESLMGAFYLATCYFAVRAFEGRTRAESAGWSGLAFLACLLGMGTKETMVTAPLLVLLWDALLFSGTLRGALKSRPLFYAALASTWIPLVFLVVTTGARAQSVGFDFAHVTFADYFTAQFLAIPLYLKLALWPTRLVFDYGWPPKLSASEYLPALAFDLALLGVGAYLLYRRRPVALLWAWFFLILAPTCVVPIVTEVYAEHRMYLSLAAIVAGVVLGVHQLIGARLPLAPRVVLVALTVLVLAWRTSEHNRLYHGPEAMWADVAAKRPSNDRGQNAYGLALMVAGKKEQAIERFERAVDLRPDYHFWRHNLATLLGEMGRYDQSLEQFRRVVEIAPDYLPGRVGLGWAYVRKSQWDQAEREFKAVLERNPSEITAHQGLVWVFQSTGRGQDAERHGKILQGLKSQSSP
jgi:tetratricopeptide (TPR) repeat protein